MSLDEPLPTIAYTADFLKLLAMPDMAAYALKPVFACRIERMSTKGLWLSRAVVFGQQGTLYLIDPSASGRVTHEVDFGPTRRKAISLDIEAKPDVAGGHTQCVRLVCDKPKASDPEVILLRFHCARGPLALQFAFVVKHFARRPCADPSLTITLTGANQSLVAVTKPKRSSSNPRSAMNALQKAMSSRSELVTVAEREKKRMEQQKQDIHVPPPKTIAPAAAAAGPPAAAASPPLPEDLTLSVVVGPASPLAQPRAVPASEGLLHMPEVATEHDDDGKKEDRKGGEEDPLREGRSASPEDPLNAVARTGDGDVAASAPMTAEERHAGQELDLLEAKMACDHLEVQLAVVRQKLADEQADTQTMRDEFAMQIDARRAELQAAVGAVRVTVDADQTAAGNGGDDNAHWEAAAVADLEATKDRLRQAAQRRASLLQERQTLEQALEASMDLGAVGLFAAPSSDPYAADADDEAEAAALEEDAEVALLMAELRGAQDELAEEQQESLIQTLAAESHVEHAFRKAILLQHGRLEQLHAQHHRLRTELMSPASEEAGRVAAAKAADDPSPIAHDPACRPRTVRELKSLIHVDLMRL